MIMNNVSHVVPHSLDTHVLSQTQCHDAARDTTQRYALGPMRVGLHLESLVFQSNAAQ